MTGNIRRSKVRRPDQPLTDQEWQEQSGYSRWADDVYYDDTNGLLEPVDTAITEQGKYVWEYIPVDDMGLGEAAFAKDVDESISLDSDGVEVHRRVVELDAESQWHGMTPLPVAEPRGKYDVYWYGSKYYGNWRIRYVPIEKGAKPETLASLFETKAEAEDYLEMLMGRE